MKILIVGAGAVGTVYGWSLERGGADVSVMVRERQVDACRKGLVVWRVSRRRPPAPALFHPSEVLTGPGEVSRRKWDQVWLCVSSTALRKEWLAPLLAAVGPAAVVSITPGLEDAAWLAGRHDPSRLATGVAAMVAWTAPLPGEAPEPVGVACWFPPFSPSLFDGPDSVRADLEALVLTLKRGGCPAAIRGHAAGAGAQASAVMLPIVVALEGERWSLDRLRRSPALERAARASREALAVASARHGRRAPAWRHLIRRDLSGLLVPLANRIVPFPLEAYLRFHFSKVRDQTAAMLEEYIRVGHSLGLPVEALERMVETGSGDDDSMRRGRPATGR